MIATLKQQVKQNNATIRKLKEQRIKDNKPVTFEPWEIIYSLNLQEESNN